jgi:hypothetical protein
MNLNALKLAIRLCLGVGASGAQLKDAELEQAIDVSLTAINRYFPRELVATHVWTKTITDEAFTSASAHATAVSLGNKPIEFGSEVVTSSPAGTTYTRNTDYEMDYINGTIKTISGGGMGLSTSFLIDYTRDPNSLNVASILTNPINIQKVDIRSGSENPRELDGWSLWGDTLSLTAQRSLADNHHINIYYRGMHTGPTDTSAGSFPRFLDDLLVIGASGYALIIEGESRRHQSVTDLASGRTALGETGALHTAIATARTAFAVTQGDINTALDLVTTTLGNVGTPITSAANALILASSSLAKYDTADTGPIAKATTDFANAVIGLGDVNDPRVSNILDKVATHATGLNGAKDAIDEINALLSSVATDATAIGTDVTAINTDITSLNTDLANLLGYVGAVNTAGNNLADELGDAATSASGYLLAGDDLLNKINNAPTAATDYATYAQARVQIAQAYAQEAQVRNMAVNSQTAAITGRSASIQSRGQMVGARTQIIASKQNSISSRLAQSSEHLKLSQIFIAETASRLSHIQMYLSSGSAKLGISDRHIASGNVSVNIALRYMDVVNGYISNATTYIQQAVTRVQEANTYVADITSLLSQIASHQTEADRYMSTADREVIVGDSLRIQGEYYIASYIAALQVRQSQVIRQRQTAAPYANSSSSRGGRNLTGSEV